MQSLEKSDQRRGLSRAQVFSIGWHVSATLDYLADQLVLREAKCDAIERRSALATHVIKRMAVATLLGLENQSASALERRAFLQIFGRDRHAAPCVHHRTPGRMQAQLRQTAQHYRNQQNRENGNGAALPALLTFAGDKREQQ